MTSFWLITIFLIVQLCIYSQSKFANREWELFPILNYDTDVGFGYGAKAFLYNFLNKNESIDLTVYNSTKGERWYQLIYSVPDKQRRHSTQYDFAFDLILDYDKWINFKHYSDNNSVEKYTREPIRVSTIFSRAFSKNNIAELGLNYTSISSYDFEEKGTLKQNTLSNTQHLSILLNLRYDSRTNLIHPKSGMMLQASGEFANDLVRGGQNYFRSGITFQAYFELLEPAIILASRISGEIMSNATFPNKLAIGGNNSIRGIPQDRYISESYLLINEELRMPIWWRFGGIFGVDIGNSESTQGWIINTVVGLRFYMDNFIVRADFGIGNETTGFYFNFGHIF